MTGQPVSIFPPRDQGYPWRRLLTAQTTGDRSPLLASVLLGAFFWNVGIANHWAMAQGPGLEPSPIRATVVQQDVIPNERSFVGTVTPIRRAVIGSAVDGRIAEVFVEEGDLIRVPESVSSIADQRDELAGVPLIQIRTATIDIELDAARSELELQLALQNELVASLPADLELAVANMGAADARLAFAKAQWERSRDLAANGTALSQSELDQIKSAYDAALQDVNAAKATVLKLENTQQARLAQANALVNNQREAIRLLEDRRQKYTVRAPFDGVVSRRVAEVGQWITTGAEVAEIVQMNPIEVVIMIPQNMLGDFQYSMAASRFIQPTTPSMSQDVNPRDPTTGDSAAVAEPIRRPAPALLASITTDNDLKTLTGTVQTLVPTADLMSRSFPLKIRLENPSIDHGYQLNPGMLVKVQITVGQKQQRLMVDKDALVLNNDGTFLLVIDRSANPPTVKSIPVQVGAAVANRIEVIGEIQDKDWVVVEGNERLYRHLKYLMDGPNDPLQHGNAVKILNAESLQAETQQRPTEVAGGLR